MRSTGARDKLAALGIELRQFAQHRRAIGRLDHVGHVGRYRGVDDGHRHVGPDHVEHCGNQVAGVEGHRFAWRMKLRDKDASLALFGDVVLNPSFPQAELDARGVAVDAVRCSAKSAPSRSAWSRFSASRQFMVGIFLNHR